MTFQPGQTVMHRSWRGGRITFLHVTRAVADDGRGTFLWMPLGVKAWRIQSMDGRTHHDAPIDQLGADAYLKEFDWSGFSCLFWKSPSEAFSVWWFFTEEGVFDGWYVNLEEPARRWDDGHVAGVDIADQALDIVVKPDRSWEWKDPDEFADLTGHPLYWDHAQAAEIRAEGERVVKLIEAQSFPFDGSWCDFQPDPAWPLPARTDGWDRPKA